LNEIEVNMAALVPQQQKSESDNSLNSAPYFVGAARIFSQPFNWFFCSITESFEQLLSLGNWQFSQSPYSKEGIG